jgi:hypothetical protein
MATQQPIEPGPSEYRIQVLHVPSGQLVEWAPGFQVERDLVAEVCRRAAEKGIGVLRTEAHVVADIKAAIEETFHDIKLDATRATS